MTTGLYLALDHMSQRKASSLLDRFGQEFAGVKTRGLFFVNRAQDHISSLRDHGAKQIWVDLKVGETPDSAAEAAMIVKEAGGDFVTVHAIGGRRMMSDVVATGIGTYAVLVLSSLNDELAARYFHDHAVDNMIEDAMAAGVTGFICPPKKVKDLASRLSKYPRHVDIVSPGTRFSNGNKHDQQQVETPGITVADGADYLVIGRMVTAANNPKKAIDRLTQEIEEAESTRQQAAVI